MTRKVEPEIMLKHLLGSARIACLFFLCSYSSVSAVAESVVVADGPISISYGEFEGLLVDTPDKIRSDAARDLGDRFAFISDAMARRKMIAEANQMTPEDPDYAALQSQLDAVKQQFIFKRAQSAYALPDLSALAEERYATQMDKYAKIPETRASSHILFYTPPGPDRTALRVKAQKILDELRAGANFEAYVAEYSGDPGSAARQGSLDRWLRFGDPDISPPYTEALFAIEAVGEYSAVTDTQFGVHIIRLDGIRESGYEPFEEVQSRIVEDLMQEHYKLATKAARTRYNLSDDAFIDGEAMEALFAPYQPGE